MKPENSISDDGANLTDPDPDVKGPRYEVESFQSINYGPLRFLGRFGDVDLYVGDPSRMIHRRDHRKQIFLIVWRGDSYGWWCITPLEEESFERWLDTLGYNERLNNDSVRELFPLLRAYAALVL